MKLIIHRLSFLVIQLWITAAHADDGWINLAESYDGMSWQAKPGSLEFVQTKGGTSVAVVTGRITQHLTSAIILRKWYVAFSECVAEQGKLITLNISGEFQDENDFVFGSGNVASAIAEVICGAATKKVIEATNKGL